MASALDAVLALKQNEQAQQENQVNSIANALNTFVQTRQQAQQAQLQNLLTMAQIENLKSEGVARQGSQNILNQVLTGKSSSGGPRVKGINIGGMNIEIPPTEEQIQQDLSLQARQADVKNQADARKTLDEYSSDALQSLNAIDKIEKQANELGDFKTGFLSQLGAKTSTELGKFSKDPKITRYVGVVSQELIPAARKLMEEKGPITEQDVNRVEKGLGDLTTPLKDKIFLLNELRDKVKQVLDNKRQVAGISEEDFKNKYKNIYDKAFSSNNQLKTKSGVEFTFKKKGE